LFLGGARLPRGPLEALAAPRDEEGQARGGEQHVDFAGQERHVSVEGAHQLDASAIARALGTILGQCPRELVLEGQVAGDVVLPGFELSERFGAEIESLAERALDAGDGDASATDAGGECTLDPEFENGFQSPCTDDENHSECTCEADYCAIMPGATEGFCTVTGCVEDPDKCPDGYMCFDLSPFGVDLSFCNPPS
jgi:hypothetical protein